MGAGTAVTRATAVATNADVATGVGTDATVGVGATDARAGDGVGEEPMPTADGVTADATAVVSRSISKATSASSKATTAAADPSPTATRQARVACGGGSEAWRGRRGGSRLLFSGSKATGAPQCEQKRSWEPSGRRQVAQSGIA